MEGIFNMKIHILRTKNSETVPRLIKHLKNRQEGYEYPDEDCFIVNFGRNTHRAHLNNNLVNNKLQQLSILKEEGLNVPDILSFNPNSVNRVPKRLIKQNLPKDVFPIMARKRKHFKGNDIIFLKTRGSLWKRLARVSTREFFVKYIPKKAEFRVHVLGDKVYNVCKKVHSESYDKHHPHIWCSPRGWTLIDYDGRHYEELEEVARQATKALGYDFGAVDIGLGKNGKFYVFEINSAPRLSRERRRFYAQYFREKEKEFRKNKKKH